MSTPLDLLRNQDLTLPLLAVCHDPADADYSGFTAALNATIWMRTAGSSHIAQPWPDAGPYKTIILPLPANRETLSLCLAACCARLTPDGTLYLFGHNEAGIKSTDKSLTGYFSDVELLGIGGHGRLYAARQPQQDYTLEGFTQQAGLALPQGITTMASYPGLFAKGKLDSATALLLDHLPALTPQVSVLDFACGIGVIAKAVQLQQPDINLTLVDHDALAVAAAKLNLPDAQLQCAALPADITGTYDLILSNPPIHDGQTLSYTVIEQLIAALPRLLTPQGAAYIVAQVTVPLEKLAAQKQMAATEVATTRSFRVTKITR